MSVVLYRLTSVYKALGEVGQSLEDRYKETALGGLAATPTGKKIAEKY